MGSFDRLFRLDGAGAVVTGGASGIGLATAQALGDAGARVTVLDQREPRHTQHATGLSAMSVDISDPSAVAAAFGQVATHHPIDILVNCAGIAIRKPAVDLPMEDWDKVVSVNMTGSFVCAREAARHMIAAGRSGAIVNVASIMGLSGGIYPNISYQTTKGAIVNMTRALAIEWAPHGIRVNAVAPTYVRTPFIAALLEQPDVVQRIEDMTPMRRIAEPEEVAAAILFLASPAAGMITGHTLPVDGGYLAQ
ncbi:MAG TPA: SDR family oxidoreductase [Geminicoccus sp.]|jgi:NAD(P)-dependent dehydrogenase (short-subunit alcohol dehydrogenase family)|uniref:SDR family NAD(P)-dependent oxidoreductase n=1 Tax=Geminicoccus sp. TaxID=2024832 RepID=UPI002E35B903|nr:SDR family oxidoreductase [Geminicoccus sp.]HEX2527950.1 SDR family oxidoreductase [Geminicoccus sp.]